MKPIEAFQDGRRRAEHLLKLAEVLTNTRQRAARADWKTNFRALMHWPKNKAFERVDGEHAILILPEECGLSAHEFREEYLNELLRSSIVAIVSALDRYCHEVISSAAIKQFDAKNPNLHRMEISLQAVHSVLTRPKRPKNALRVAIQKTLYERTFQSPHDIAEGFKLAGKSKIWTACSKQMNCEAQDIITRLSEIVRRRNRIVHEGDLVRHERAGGVRCHPISAEEVKGIVLWVGSLVDALELI